MPTVIHDTTIVTADEACTVQYDAAIAARRGLSPRIADLETYGCTITLGTDNMAEDMVEVMRDGRLLTMDEAAIVPEADRIGRAAWQRLFAAQPALVPPPGWHPAGGEGNPRARDDVSRALPVDAGADPRR